jgi:hypothetical protein
MLQSKILKTSLILLGVTLAQPLSTRAWDEHANLTRAALRGARVTDPALFNLLEGTRLQVRPLSAFLEKHFPLSSERPRTERIERVQLEYLLQDVGPDFRVQFTSRYQASEIILDWEKGWSTVAYQFDNPKAAANPQALGKYTTALEVLSVYSDEADWLMDDGVERLADAAPSIGKTVGTATRVFRHFWYEGDPDVPADVRRAQELDERVALFLKLSRRAFELSEPYWGYRFLASALHYLQDITQPFHIRLLPDSGFINSIRLAQAGLCDLHLSIDDWGHSLGNSRTPPPDRCSKDGGNLDTQTVQEAWVLSAYHMALEDFSNRAIALGNPQVFSQKPEQPLPLPAANQFTDKFLTEFTAKVDERFTVDIGESLLAVTGRRWTHHPAEARKVLESLWTDDSVGIGLQRRLERPEGRRESERMARLEKEATRLLLHTAELTRQVVRTELILQGRLR